MGQSNIWLSKSTSLIVRQPGYDQFGCALGTSETGWYIVQVVSIIHYHLSFYSFKALTLNPNALTLTLTGTLSCDQNSFCPLLSSGTHLTFVMWGYSEPPSKIRRMQSHLYPQDLLQIFLKLWAIDLVETIPPLECNLASDTLFFINIYIYLFDADYALSYWKLWFYWKVVVNFNYYAPRLNSAANICEMCGKRAANFLQCRFFMLESCSNITTWGKFDNSFYNVIIFDVLALRWPALADE